jgi:hypothetical protein
MLPQQFLEYHVRVFSTHQKGTPEANALARAAASVLKGLRELQGPLSRRGSDDDSDS